MSKMDYYEYKILSVVYIFSVGLAPKGPISNLYKGP